MATVIFAALGTLIGGPLGGAIGALVGRQVDGAIIGGPRQEGPRLKELAVTTSSYGTPIPRHFGRMRVAGTIVWATDLVEHRKRSGGGKGRPRVTTYSYTTSFAVALASRPIRGIGRIWADGNLLRGAAGDLKVDGTFRLHLGHRDQPRDPFIAAAEGASQCPAFRGLAYAVFEDLALGDFGNRIPALTFEVLADDGALDLAVLADGLVDDADLAVPLPGLAGFSGEGALADTLALLDPVWPMDCDAGGGALTVARERLQAEPILLAAPAIAVADGDFGGGEGFTRNLSSRRARPPESLRYYDIERDYQPGVQRPTGRAGEGQPASIELPAALVAADARTLAETAARRVRWAEDTISWRCCELAAEVAPGAVVALPGISGLWHVNEWEWRASGVELVLVRVPPASGFAPPVVDPGRASPPIDAAAGATVLTAFELPWDGAGSGDMPALYAAVASPSPRWGGAALFVDQGDGALVPLGPSGRARSVMGAAVDVLPAGSALLFDRGGSVTVELVGADMELPTATARQLAMGANRAQLGGEMIQFAAAVPLGARRWRLSNLLRGRGGSEGAIGSHLVGEPFVLLDDTLVALDAATVGASPDALIAAIGLGDADPVTAAIACRGWTLRPPAPVHPRARTGPDGTLLLGWTRRARGAWAWNDGVDVPLQEQAEAYQLSYGPIGAPLAVWELDAPALAITPAMLADLAAALPGGSFRVRQRGSHALSDPLALSTLS